MKPIPDEVLRVIAAPIRLFVEVTDADRAAAEIEREDLARELIALRQAARRYLNAGEPDERGESEYALMALLPESAGAEGGEPS